MQRTLYVYLCLTGLFLCSGCVRTPSLVSVPQAEQDAGPMAMDPVTALNHLRLLEYQNDVDEVLKYLATPAAGEFVLKRSRAATRKNIAAIQDNRYGFEVLAGKAVGDAGLTMLRVVDLNADPASKITPFYLWRIGGVWHFLPNPTVVSTWYQAVPTELRDNYAQLAQWYDETIKQLEVSAAAEPLPSPEELLTRYWSEVQE